MGSKSRTQGYAKVAVLPAFWQLSLEQFMTPHSPQNTTPDPIQSDPDISHPPENQPRSPCSKLSRHRFAPRGKGICVKQEEGS